MSIHAMMLIKQRQFGSTTRKAIMLVLADYADEEMSTFVGQERLAREAEVSTKTVSRTLRAFEDEGLIIRKSRWRDGDTGGRTSDRVYLVEAAIMGLPDTMSGKGLTDIRGGGYRTSEGGLTDIRGGVNGQSLSGYPSVEPTEEQSVEPCIAANEQSALVDAVSPSKPKRAKTRPEIPLPDGWAPTPEHRALAAKHGLDLELELVKFRGHAEANDRRQKSWNGAFTTWLGNAATYSRRSNGHREPAESLGSWRLVTMRCGGCDERLQIDAMTNQPISPHHCSQGAMITGIMNDGVGRNRR